MLYDNKVCEGGGQCERRNIKIVLEHTLLSTTVQSITRLNKPWVAKGGRNLRANFCPWKAATTFNDFRSQTINSTGPKQKRMKL